MSDGRGDEQLKLELAGDGYFGFNGDKTADLFARVSVPLFTRWANITLWMPVYEWYSQADGTGSGAGDVYIATNIQVLHNDWFKTEKARYIPQMTVRVGVKTASGEQFQRKRHFDSPGYFFDLAIGQTIPIRSINLRFAGSVGFLCWQTTEARQNDAVMYGLQAQLNHEYFSLQAEWGGYPFRQSGADTSAGSVTEMLRCPSKCGLPDISRASNPSPNTSTALRIIPSIRLGSAWPIVFLSSNPVRETRSTRHIGLLPPVAALGGDE